MKRVGIVFGSSANNCHTHAKEGAPRHHLRSFLKFLLCSQLILNPANAPVSKALMVLAGVGSVGAWVFNARPLLALDVGGLSHLQLWRLVSHPFVFQGVGELLFGLLLLNYLRVFERQMGSVRYASFALSSLGVSTLLQVAVLGLYRPSGQRLTFAGPYGLIFSSLVLFYREIPAFYKFKLLGVPLTDKILMYLLLLQLAFSNVPSSALSATCGLLAGAVYVAEPLGLGRWSVPDSLVALIRRVLGPFFGTPPSSRTRLMTQITPSLVQATARAPPQTLPPGPAPPAAGIDPAMAALQQMLFQHQQQLQQGIGAPAGPASEAHLQAIEGMGFTREQARLALERTNNNLDLAVAFLLDQ